MWREEIIQIYEKYMEIGGEYKPTDSEWSLICSPEFAFYQGSKSMPTVENQRQILLENDDLFLSTVLKAENTKLVDWICELVQNALDKNAHFCRLIIDNEKGTMSFSHDGEGVSGPQPPQSRIGDVEALMTMGISLKKTDMKSEGRFGVGFKYWKKHYSMAELSFEEFSITWTADYKNVNCSTSENNPGGLTTFKFSGRKSEVKEAIDHSELSRLKDAMKLRTSDLKFRIDLDGKTEEWTHKVEDRTKINLEGLEDTFEIISCKESISNDHSVMSTLAEFPINSEAIPEKLRKELRDELIDEYLTHRRNRSELGLGSESTTDEAFAEITEYMGESTLTLGFFHDEEDLGSLVSMFSISGEGKTRSRISFSGPFSIQPDRLHLRIRGEERRKPDRNRVLIQMMISCYGHFLLAIQKNSLIPHDLIHFLLENPPGEGDSELDQKIKEYASQKTRSDYDFSYSYDELPVSEIVSVECWPTIGGGLNQVGNHAKQIDPILIEYREELSEASNDSDLRWLDEHLEEITIAHGKDASGLHRPITNWIIYSQSEAAEVGFSGIANLLEGGV